MFNFSPTTKLVALMLANYFGVRRVGVEGEPAEMIVDDFLGDFLYPRAVTRQRRVNLKRHLGRHTRWIEEGRFRNTLQHTKENDRSAKENR